MLQASKLDPRIMRYEFTDHAWAAIRPMLPNMPRGVPRVNDRGVLNGIFRVLRSDAPWRDLPQEFGPAPIPLATSASSAGVWLACAAGSWTQRLLRMMLPSK